MWHPTSSVRSRSGTVVRLASLVAMWGAGPAVGQEAGGLPVSESPVGAPEVAVADVAWEPPAELASGVRARVARSWGMSPDSIQIEWLRPTRPLDGITKVARLLGPGRGGSWIAVLESDRRASLRFRAGVRVWTPVARVDLPRDRALTAADIEWAHAVSWGPPIDRDLRTRSGWVTRRPIGMGERLVAPAVTAPPAVKSGQIVTVRMTTGRVTIELPGRVVGEAAEGETVLVRLNTGLRLRGVAADSNTVVLSKLSRGAATALARGRRRSRQH